MSRFKLHVFALAAALSMAALIAFFEGLALAQSAEVAIPDPSEVDAFASLLWKAAQQPDKSFAVLLALIALVSVLRRFLPVMQTDRAGAVAALVLAMLGGLATALASGRPLDLPLVATAIGIGLKAIGGYVGVRKLLGLKSTTEVA